MWDPTDKTPIKLTEEQAEILANMEPVSFSHVESRLIDRDSPEWEYVVKALKRGKKNNDTK